MSAMLTGGLALAGASTAALNYGFFVQHRAASSSMPALSLRRPGGSLRALFTNLRWLGGFIIGLGGWALYIVALRIAPLSLVQAVSAGGVGLLALLVTRVTHTELRKREWAGVALSMLGLLLLGLSLTGQSSTGDHHVHWAAVVMWVSGSVALAGFFAGPGRVALAAGAGFGVAAGLLYAAGDIATKAAVAGGAATLFTLAVLVCHGGAFVAIQLGFQRGGAIATVGVATLFTNALPIAAGMLLYQEHPPAGGQGVSRVIAFAAVVLGAALLARGDKAPAPTPAWQEAQQASDPAPSASTRAHPV